VAASPPPPSRYAETKGIALLGALLAAVAADPALGETLVFKGGTALKRLYFGDAYRFSEDLDLSAIDAPRGGVLAEALDRARASAVDTLGAEGPFAETLEPLRVRDKHPGGQDAVVVRFRFPWHREALCPIKVEVTHDELVLLPPVRRPILPGSGLGPAGSLRVLSLTSGSPRSSIPESAIPKCDANRK